MTKLADPYAVLGIARTADAVTIRAAYRLRALEHHPDRPGGSTLRIQAITRAYGILADASSRAAWDRSAARPLHTPPKRQRPPSRGPSPAPSATPKSAWHRPPDARDTSAATSNHRSTTQAATGTTRLIQWSAVFVVLAGIQELTIGGGEVLLALAATVLAIHVFLGCRDQRQPFWPWRDAGTVLRGLFAARAVFLGQRSSAR